MDESRPAIRVMALRALAYCERLFYLEEVEEIRVPDDRVFDGRTLHETLDSDGELAWASDRLQVGAYALLVEEATGEAVSEGRVRYHGSNATVRVPIDDNIRAEVRNAIGRAQELMPTVERPPVTANERLCARCSLAPVCLPEEARAGSDKEHPTVRLFPPDDERRPIHVLGHGGRIGRSGDVSPAP
jgi:CRISPR-associated protein Cas1